MQQEETFFSNQVTHIITGRPIPSEEAVAKALSGEEGTINPSVLEVKSNGKAATRRDAVNANDIIVRGLQMKMKVWPSEKLQKILNALMEVGYVECVPFAEQTTVSALPATEYEVNSAYAHELKAALGFGRGKD